MRIRPSVFLLLGSFTFMFILILPYLVLGEFYGAREFLERINILDFILGHEWSLAEQKYGALPAIYGTFVVAGLALLIALPISLGSAITLAELLPRSIADRMGMLIDMIAAIPSVVVGLWGLLTLAPLLDSTLYVFMTEHLSFLPFTYTPHLTPYNKLTASLVLAFMITPYAVAVIKENLRLVPTEVKEAAYALGLTKWESIKIMLGYIKPGVFAAFMLALGRAIGEAVAVSMVVGNTCSFSASLLEPACTLTTLLINNFAEATGIVAAALIGLGLILFIISLALVMSTRLIYSKLLGGYAR